jgi:hypothetical protein
MRDQTLDGHLVNGYRNVLGLGENEARRLLYHHLFSGHEPGFQNGNREIQWAIDTTEASLAAFAAPRPVSNNGRGLLRKFGAVRGNMDHRRYVRKRHMIVYQSDAFSEHNSLRFARL